MRLRKYVIKTVEVLMVLGLVTLFQKYHNAKKAADQPVPMAFSVRMDPKTLETVKNFTVLISNEDFVSVGRGTGVVIDSMTVLTCYHMAGNDMWIYPHSGHIFVHGHPIYGDRFHDLLIVQLDTPIILDHYAQFNSSVTIGEPIVLVGNILGSMKWFVSYGVLSERLMFYLMTNAVSNHGMSGGPWVDMDGKVVAITDWGLEDSNKQQLGIGGGVSAEAIESFIRAWKNPNIFDILLGMAK
jgi:S1-C subfamily serine protease